jgi:hypothetical protein
MIVISIDPGLTGACSVQDHNGLRAVFDLPTMPIPGVGPQALVQSKLDGVEFKRLLLANCPAGEPVRAVIEAVGTMGGKNNAIQTQGSLLRTLGAIETVLELLGTKPTYAHPQTWKKHFGLIDSKLSDRERKAKATECARRLFPGRAEFARVKDHNRAESALLGLWLLEGIL